MWSQPAVEVQATGWVLLHTALPTVWTPVHTWTPVLGSSRSTGNVERCYKESSLRGSTHPDLRGQVQGVNVHTKDALEGPCPRGTSQPYRTLEIAVFEIIGEEVEVTSQGRATMGVGTRSQGSLSPHPSAPSAPLTQTSPSPGQGMPRCPCSASPERPPAFGHTESSSATWAGKKPALGSQTPHVTLVKDKMYQAQAEFFPLHPRACQDTWSHEGSAGN